MRVLVIGSGGREHALVWKLAQELEVFCTPGNAGIAEECETFTVPWTDTSGILDLAKRLEIGLVVIGAEDPLVAGLGDSLRNAELLVFGPGADGAKHEASKSWSKNMMLQARVPTSSFKAFHESQSAIEFAESIFDMGRQAVIKADGAALGKGVVVCDTLDQAKESIAMMVDQGKMGKAGRSVVVEERIIGKEFSLLTLVSGQHHVSLPVAQDYKRAYDNDQGANTGGMGSYSPVPWISDELLNETEVRIVEPMIRQMAENGIDYRGVLFSGIMVADGHPYCLEYNVRFGDPEIESLAMRLGDGFAEALTAVAQGNPVPPPTVNDVAATCVMVASGGYPGAYKKGVPVSIGAMPESVKVFHAGTISESGQVVTNGGRVLAVAAASSTLDEARNLAYSAVEKINFEGMEYRKDIARLTPQR